MADHQPNLPQLIPRPIVPNKHTNIRPMTATEEAALRAETRRLQDVVRETCGGMDLIETIPPQHQLPKHLKLPQIDKYDGTEDPRVFLNIYARTLQTHGLNDNHMAQLFPRYLAGVASQWFWGTEVSRAVSFEEVAQRFIDQFQDITPLKVTLRELRMIKQNPGEEFRAFFNRWRDVFVQVIDRPSERDLVQMIVWNLQPMYFRYTFAQPLRTLQELIQAGTQIDDAVGQDKLKWERAESSLEKGENEMGSVNFSHGQPSKDKPRRRKFSSWGKPISKVMKKLVKEGYLKPLDPIPPSDRPSKKRKLDQYCAFHQNHGHHTDNCIRLREEIQNLVDAEIIAPPPPKHHCHNP